MKLKQVKKLKRYKDVSDAWFVALNSTVQDKTKTLAQIDNIIGGRDKGGFWRISSRVSIIHESEIDNQSAWIKIDPKEELKIVSFLIWLRNLSDFIIPKRFLIIPKRFLYKNGHVLLLVTFVGGGVFWWSTTFIGSFLAQRIDNSIENLPERASRPKRNVMKVEETTQTGPLGLNRRKVYKVTYEDENGVIRTEEKYSDPTK